MSDDDPNSAAPDPTTNDPELAPGDRAGPYVVVRTIAAGGCGTVYEAEHRVLGRRVALKVLHRRFVESTEMVERFVREARAVNLIHHPNIVDIVAFGALSDSRPYQVMELLEGVTLDQFVLSHGRLAVMETLDILEPVCAALEAAHACGVVHRDLKPSNVFVGTRHGKSTIKLLDFGIAKLLEPPPGHAGLTALGRKLGTPLSMAPEQIAGERITHAVDVYALGVSMYFCLTGTYPFVADTAEAVEHLHLHAQPPAASALAAVPRSIDAIVARCMAKAAKDRFPSVKEAISAVRAAVTRKTPGEGSFRATLAVAIYVEIAQTEEETDDASELLALEDVATVVELSKVELARGGYSFPEDSGDTVLAVRAIAEDAKQRVVADAVAMARNLAAKLVARAGAHPANRPSISVHVDSALERRDGARDVAYAGPIVRVQSWASTRVLPDVHVTAAAMRAVAGDDEAS